MMFNTNQLFLKLLRAAMPAKKFLALLAVNPILENFVKISDKELQLFSLTAEQISRWRNVTDAAIAADLQWLEQEHNHLLTIIDPAYPSLLKTIYDPPIALFVKGDVNLLSSMQLAIVGSRNPTAVGKEMAFEFAQHLASMGMTITSGLATGIDAASHRGALAATGKTIAVCGTGLDRVYPARHHALAQEIVAHGALVSEFPIGTIPDAFNFPKRNRIISGLSLGTLVVEAALQSGSLITAHQAIEQGREVFAIPGSIHNPLARGCHKLIREGAKLVETAEDLLEELGQIAAVADISSSLRELEKNTSTLILDKDYQKLLNCIGYETTAVDVIVAQTGWPANQVASMLLILELNSYITAETGGYTRRK